MAARVKVSVVVDPQREAEFDRAFELLRELVDSRWRGKLG